MLCVGELILGESIEETTEAVGVSKSGVAPCPLRGVLASRALIVGGPTGTDTEPIGEQITRRRHPTQKRCRLGHGAIQMMGVHRQLNWLRANT